MPTEQCLFETIPSSGNLLSFMKCGIQLINLEFQGLSLSRRSRLSPGPSDAAKQRRREEGREED